VRPGLQLAADFHDTGRNYTYKGMNPKHFESDPEWVWVSSSFLTAQKHEKGYLVPFKVCMMDKLWK